VAVTNNGMLCLGHMTCGCFDWFRGVLQPGGWFSVGFGRLIGYFLTPLRGQLTADVTWARWGKSGCMTEIVIARFAVKGG
jgi:hypothetical protein